MRQNFGTEDDEAVMVGLEEVWLGGDQDAEMVEEDEELCTRNKGGNGRQRAKKRNIFIKDECKVAKRGGEDAEEDKDD